MTTKPVCPVCQCMQSAHYKTWNEMDLFTCEGCQTIYLFPMPDADGVADIYDNAYDGATSGYFAKVDKKMRRSRHRARTLKKYASGTRFLDVGCNGGFMVEAARYFGFDATGVELDPVSLGFARETYPDNTYFLGKVEAFEPQGGGFDLIYSSEVIEHVPDPNSFVSTIARLLNPGGAFYVTTPDISHWRRPRDVEQWDAFCPPSHCIYFNPKSLVGLLERHGLVIEKKRVAFKPGIKVLARKPG